MNNAVFSEGGQVKQPKIKRPIMSDADGTREGGLTFPIVFIVGFIAAAAAHPEALTSFWVWFALLMMSVAVAVGVQKAVARFYGYAEADGTENEERT